MYNGKHTGRVSSSKRAARRRRRRIRNTALSLALILLLGMAIGGTIAYLTRDGGSVTNNFVPGKVTIEIHEGFNENTGVKSSVEIENKSNIPVYIRVALVGNWADKDGKICIKHNVSDPLSALTTLGDGWVYNSNDGFYYYTKSVAVGGKTTDLLGKDITLTEEDDGCTYQLEVIASAIQAEGNHDTDNELAVYDAWGTSIPSLQ